MASAWTEEEAFVCPVCLDPLKEPTTLPCGHSYCLVCIQRHWDKNHTHGQYSCPQCRQIFNPRPSLAKSTVLAEVMEKLRTNSLKGSPSTSSSTAPPSYLDAQPDGGLSRSGIYPQLPTVDVRQCPDHNLPLDMFCRDDRVCVCEVCFRQGHKGHHVLRPEEERKERQKELIQMQEEVQRRIQGTDRKLKEIPHAARQYKALVQALGHESTDLFSELAQTVSLTGSQVAELLGTLESSLGSLVEGQVNRLEQEMAQLSAKSEDLNGLAYMQDHICFLKNFHIMEPLGPTGATEESALRREEARVAAIRSVMKNLQISVLDQCKTSQDTITTLVNSDTWTPPPDGAAAAAACSSEPESCGQDNALKTASLQISTAASAPPLVIPPHLSTTLAPAAAAAASGHVKKEPKTRDELLKFRFEPTLDPNTAYRHVLLSKDGQKATLRPENVNPPPHPERFQFWRQVLCSESLAGSPYYWEVEWTGQKITIGVAYEDMDRKGSDNKSRLGHNPQSWSLYWSGTAFSFWHDGQETHLSSPKARRIGIYLDQQVGILTFYCINNNMADVIYHHHTQFTSPLYPGFRFWSEPGSTVTVCQLG